MIISYHPKRKILTNPISINNRLKYKALNLSIILFTINRRIINLINLVITLNNKIKITQTNQINQIEIKCKATITDNQIKTLIQFQTHLPELIKQIISQTSNQINQEIINKLQGQISKINLLNQDMIKIIWKLDNCMRVWKIGS